MVWPDQGSRSTSSSPSSKTGSGVWPPWVSSRLTVVAAARCKGVFVSELLDDELDEGTLTDLVAGSVGEGLAVKFMAHRKVASEMPNPTDILAGKVKEMKTSEISAMYSLTVSLCYELKEASDKNDKMFDTKVNNFLRFAMDNFETELVVMGIKLALSQYALPIDPDEVECFDEFHNRFGKFIKAAQQV